MQSSFAYFVAKYLGYRAAMYDGSVYEWVHAAGNKLVMSPTPERGDGNSSNKNIYQMKETNMKSNCILSIFAACLLISLGGFAASATPNGSG